MTLIDLVNSNEWEKSKKYQKHLQGVDYRAKMSIGDLFLMEF